MDLAECSKLENLSGVEKSQQLETVELEGCRKLHDISLLSELENIKYLVLTDCGLIRLLQPLASCRLLENVSFVGDTIIEDGMLAPIIEYTPVKENVVCR